MTNRYGGERFKRGLWHFVLGKALSAISGFFALVLVVRLLPIHEFANYSVLVSLVELFSAFSALGLSHALLRYVPELYVKRYKMALREFVLGAFVLRAGMLLLATGLSYACSASIAPIIGLDNFVEAFRVFLLVVIFRTTNHFLSQILESTLHQGIVQFNFSLSSVVRLVGMVYLMHINYATLLNVIWVEVLSDLLAMLAMLAGVVRVIWYTAQEEDSPTDDGTWFKKNLRKIVYFARSGYTQHIVGLPFGSNTNRLVGGHLFSSSVMASFGFAQSFYEYIKRYLPAQLLIGMIRPIVVARFSETRDFNAAASTWERVILINMVLIGGIFSALAVGGDEALIWVSGGKYGMEALWVLAALLVVLALETHRLILEMLVQMVERYAILFPSNIMLSLSILPAILLFPYLGAVGFPLINAVALVFSNLWVKRQLAVEGFSIAHAWRATVRLFMLMLVASLIGNALRYKGLHWLVSMTMAEILFLLGAWKLHRHDLSAFISDLMGKDKVLPKKLSNKLKNIKRHKKAKKVKRI